MAYTTINKFTDYFNTKLYSGNGSTQSITGVGFQPDFTWIKERNDTPDHKLIDSVRGVTKVIESNTTDVESTLTTGITSFDSDGFSLGANGSTNGGSDTYASWNWKAGTTGSGTTNQSKDYEYSVNTTSGFSIVRYKGSGTTNHKIPHHLGVKPDVILVKSTESTHNWTCYWDIFQNSANYIRLNVNNAVASDSTKWDGYANTTTINLGSANDTNQSSSNFNFVAYCFASKTGYSKFGLYTGNNNADGRFVYTGFKPSFIIVKPSNYADNWHIIDDKRNTFNPMDTHMFPNLNNGDSTASSYDFDMLSNGFKPRSNNSAFNGSYNYIYMAFGQSLVGSNNVPCTAR